MNVTTKQFLDGAETAIIGVEQRLNTLGYVPGLSTLTGSFRWGLGVTELEIGALLTFGYMFEALVFCSSEKAEGIGRSFGYVGHGLGNMARGAVESVPLINLLTILYDQMARYKYSVEAKTTITDSFLEILA